MGQKTSAWSPTDCAAFKITPDPDTPVECGYVTVPLRHANPTGKTIQLATVILTSISADRRPDPLFMAQGGPGGSTIDTYGSHFLNTPGARPTTNRDIVLWDQRGTLFSRPFLICNEINDAQLKSVLVPPEATDADGDAAVEACGARLASEVGDLSAFNSAENADDVEDVRAALGYDRFNFYGVSYGTELGQFLMKQHPERLNAAVLDAVVPLSYNLFTEPAFAKQRIAEKYFAGCAAEPRCNAAFPNLAERYLAMIDRLEASPVTVTVARESENYKQYQVSLSGGLLEGTLYTSLYSDARTLIPLVINRADQGDFSFITSLFLPLALFDDTMANGMHEIVACADRGDTDPSMVDYSRLLPRLAEAERSEALEELEICKLWNVELLPRAALEPIQSNIPTLLLSGEYDPITPPEYAATLLPGLSRGQHVVFSLGSHGQAVSSACSNGIIARFLDAPSTTVEGSCAIQTVPRFTTEEDIITVPGLKRALASGGVGGLLQFGLSAAPGAVAALVMLSALLFYPIGWIIGLIRRRPDTRPHDWTRFWALVAPWLAIATGLVLTTFIVGVGVAIIAVLTTNQELIGLGAVPSTWRWLFRLPTVALGLVGLMTIATVAMWRSRRRSLIGRVYYTVLLLIGAGCLQNLNTLGLLAR